MPRDDSASVPSTVTDALRELIDEAGVTRNRALIARILATGVGLGLDDTTRLDLKITASALSEMRAAFRLFADYRDIPKVTVFGSARTQAEDRLYHQARDVARALAEHGWMVVTGAGPGIMQAAAEGAGRERSLGVSIRLPFEEKPNEVFADGAQNVAMKYFFTRKLMLVKESSGFVCVPGGFGTLDEFFELLTLLQTGKAEPTPVVLLDAVGGSFWSDLKRFVDGTMIPAGVISPDDFDRVVITDSVEVAADVVTRFWRNYDSLRWVGDRLVLRVKHQPTDAEVLRLNEEFGFLLRSGRIVAGAALAEERVDDDRVDLPRLVLDVNPYKVGSLFRLINALNDLPSAQEV